MFIDIDQHDNMHPWNRSACAVVELAVDGGLDGGCVGKAVTVVHVTAHHVVVHDVDARCRTRNFVEHHTDGTQPIKISSTSLGSVIGGNLVGVEVGAKLGDFVGRAWWPCSWSR